MSDLQRQVQTQIYGAIVRMHPAQFRDEFGGQMVHDFADALEERGFALLLGDACLSLARQWRVRLFTRPEPEQAAAGHPFLAGQYCMVRQGSSLNAFDLARASVLSFLIFLLVGFAANLPNRHAVGDPVDRQVSHGGAPDSIKTASNAAADASRRVRSARWSPDTAGDGGAYGHIKGPIRLSPPALGFRMRLQAHGYPTPGTLQELIWQLTLISVIVWLTSIFSLRASGVMKRIVLAAFGLLGIVATVTYAQVPAPAAHPQVLHLSEKAPIEVVVIDHIEKPTEN